MDFHSSASLDTTARVHDTRRSRASEDEHAAWEELVRDHETGVYQHAYRLTGNRHDAEDLTQDTFLRAFPHLLGPRLGSTEGWLYRITCNLFLDQVRRDRSIRLYPLSEYATAIADLSTEPERLIADCTFAADVLSALQELSGVSLESLVLHDMYGFTYAEIAARHEVVRGTVASRLSRGRAQLRAALVRRAPPSTHLPSP